MAALAMAITVHAGAQLGESPHVRFIVLGDDRLRFPGAEGGLRNGYDVATSGINEGVFGQMLYDAFNRKPDFMLVTGDLISGESETIPGLPDLNGELAAWICFMKAHNAGNVPVFPIRGNHELRGKDPTGAWKQIADMTAEYGKSMDGYQTDGFSLGFNFKNVTILGMDCYTAGKNVADIDWAKNNVLNHKQAHVFEFSHPMCFFTGGHEDHLTKTNRDDFLNMLVDAGCRAFFAGHDHLYDRVKVSRADGRWNGASIVQYVAGTAGAPFYVGKPLPESDKAEDGTTYKLTRKKSDHVEMTFGYLIVDVDGDKPPKITPVFFKVPGLKDPSTMKAGN
jgi:hypothetical protein